MDLSVVIPVLDEVEVLPALSARLAPALDALGLSWEVVFVDDGSSDDTFGRLTALHAKDPRFGVVALSRNFGQQVALQAGLARSRGRAVVLMDADLQDPPERIADLVAKWREGFDVVYAVRASRDGDSLFKRGTAALFYRLVRALAPVDLPVDAGDFRLLSRPVVDAILAMPERHRYLRGLVAWTGFRQAKVVYDRAPRAAGVTKYPLRRMSRLASDAIVSFSTVPLRAATVLGFTLSAACFAYAAWAVWVTLVYGRNVPGWASLLVVILLVGGAQLVCLGIIGEYIGRIYDEVRHRPLYLVRAELLGDTPRVRAVGDEA